MSDHRFQTMRHIEAVRNYLTGCCQILSERGMSHDQSKLQSPEREIFESSQDLSDTDFGSPEYERNLKEIQTAITHHHTSNRHHPEHHPNGISDMNMFDLLEMIVDWRASNFRHGRHLANFDRSLEMCGKKFQISPELLGLLKRTMDYLEENTDIYHKADES